MHITQWELFMFTPFHLLNYGNRWTRGTSTSIRTGISKWSKAYGKESFHFKQKQPWKFVIALCYSSWDKTRTDHPWNNWSKTKYSKLCQPFFQLLFRLKGPLLPFSATGFFMTKMRSSLSDNLIDTLCFHHHFLLKFNKVTYCETHLCTVKWYFAYQLFAGFILGVE